MGLQIIQEEKLLIAFFIIALVILAFVICLTIWNKKDRVKIWLGGMFLMLVVLNIPLQLANDNGKGNIFHELGEAFYSSVQIIGADGQYISEKDSNLLVTLAQQENAGSASDSAAVSDESVKKDVAEEGTETKAPEDIRKKGNWLPFAYIIFLDILYCVSPLLFGGALLDFLIPIHAQSKLLYAHIFRKEIYYFSEPSEKALALAENLKKKLKSGSIVFFCVPRDDYDDFFSKGFIPFHEKITEARSRYFKKNASIVFFYSEKEEKNMEDTLQFISLHKDRNSHIFLYTFSTRPEAELLLNSRDTGNLVCRIISESRAAAIKYICLNRKNFDPVNREVHLLFIGFGSLGTELLRGFLWAYAWEGRNLFVDIVDKDPRKEYFFRSFPGLKEGENSVYDKYQFTLNFIEKDVQTLDIENDLPDPELIDNVYIASGNDASSLEYAIYLRQEFSRYWIRNQTETAEEKVGRKHSVPKIEVVMKNLDASKLEFTDAAGEDYNIRSFLNGCEYYSGKMLLNNPFEITALKRHLCYKVQEANGDYEKVKSEEKRKVLSRRYYIYTQVDELMPDDIDNKSGLEFPELFRNFHKSLQLIKSTDSELFMGFYKHDYNVRSSMAQSVFSFIHYWDDSASGVNEHIRWHAFMLSEGYQYGQKKCHIAKLHPSMKRDVSETEKEKDDSVKTIMERAARNSGEKPSSQIKKPQCCFFRKNKAE